MKRLAMIGVIGLLAMQSPVMAGDWQTFKGLPGTEGTLRTKGQVADPATAVAAAADAAEKAKARAAEKAAAPAAAPAAEAPAEEPAEDQA